ncbi:MAG: pyridoxine 5'-phosphate synthase [Rickettsiales bacterium]|jgi:pyridoxine 5-phosphate synthase|nr:pyridoxine 5'-phosphate synthase [Rickettsiales bacterium]
MIRLGINIDHVATVRNARGGDHPCPVRAALMAMEAGADGITAHLREDRRHIRDYDIERLKAEVALPLNLEMAMTDEMLAIALRVKPHAVCLVPEKRTEVTTEGGLDVVRLEKQLIPYVKTLQDNGARVSLFIDPVEAQVEAAKRTGAKVVELHTGTYAEFAVGSEQLAEKKLQPALCQLRTAAQQAARLGLEVHAGHGLNYDNVAPIAAIPEVVELNIGHFLMGEAMFVGMKESITTMKRIILEARS